MLLGKYQLLVMIPERDIPVLIIDRRIYQPRVHLILMFRLSAPILLGTWIPLADLQSLAASQLRPLAHILDHPHHPGSVDDYLGSHRVEGEACSRGGSNHLRAKCQCDQKKS